MMAPGWPLALIFGFLSRSDSFLVLLAATFLGYLGIMFAIVFLRCRSLDKRAWRRGILVLSPPVAVLVVLACIPTLDPLLPRGLNALRRKESALASQIRKGTTLAKVSEVLKANKIDCQEEIVRTETDVLSRGDVTVHASAGDRVLFNRPSPDDVQPDTDAYEFPCRYHLQIVAVFGQDEKLKQQYIGESRLCP